MKKNFQNMYASNRKDISKPFYAINEADENELLYDSKGVTIETSASAMGNQNDYIEALL